MGMMDSSKSIGVSSPYIEISTVCSTLLTFGDIANLPDAVHSITEDAEMINKLIYNNSQSMESTKRRAFHSLHRNDNPFKPF